MYPNSVNGSSHPRSDLGSEVASVEGSSDIQQGGTKLVFTSMVRFSGIPKFLQLAMSNLVNEIAVGELKKYCEDGRMSAGE